MKTDKKAIRHTTSKIESNVVKDDLEIFIHKSNLKNKVLKKIIEKLNSKENKT